MKELDKVLRDLLLIDEQAYLELCEILEGEIEE